MAASYLAEGRADDRVAFELSCASCRRDRGYLVAAGLAAGGRAAARSWRSASESLGYLRAQRHLLRGAVERLATLRFDGDLDAVPEGTAVAAGEPLLRVEGGRLLCQLVETVLLNQTNFQTLIATKAARMVRRRPGGRWSTSGFRRAHGADAGVLAARAAYLGGCAATATVAAGMLWDIPTVGTMAHSFVMGFESELAAFSSSCARTRRRGAADRHLRHRCTAPARGRGRPRHRHARRASCGSTPATSTCWPRQVREMLDAERAGGDGDLRIRRPRRVPDRRLVAAGAPVDGFGVGTALVTSSDAPALGGVYKLVESDGRPVMKMSAREGDAARPPSGVPNGGGDVIGLVGRGAARTALLEPVLRGGRAGAAAAAARRRRATRRRRAGRATVADARPDPSDPSRNRGSRRSFGPQGASDMSNDTTAQDGRPGAPIGQDA